MYNFLLKREQQVDIGAHIPCQMKKQTETPGERCLKVKSEFFQQIVLQKMSHQPSRLCSLHLKCGLGWRCNGYVDQLENFILLTSVLEHSGYC